MPRSIVIFYLDSHCVTELVVVYITNMFHLNPFSVNVNLFKSEKKNGKAVLTLLLSPIPVFTAHQHDQVFFVVGHAISLTVHYTTLFADHVEYQV